MGAKEMRFVYVVPCPRGFKHVGGQVKMGANEVRVGRFRYRVLCMMCVLCVVCVCVCVCAGWQKEAAGRGDDHVAGKHQITKHRYSC